MLQASASPPGPLALDLDQLVKKPHELLGFKSRTHGVNCPLIDSEQSIGVALLACKVCESCHQDLGVLKFADAIFGICHGIAGVEHELDGDIGLYFSLLDQVALGPRVHLP